MQAVFRGARWIAVLIASGFVLQTLTSLAQTASDRARNLSTCLSGRYPILCDKSLLSPEQRGAAEQAERRENLKTCLTGRYKALCNNALLTDAQRKQVQVAEKLENLKTCQTGRYPALCDKSLLTPAELAGVQAAEQQWASNQLRAARSPRAVGRPAGSTCEADHWIESVADDGKIIKLEDGSIWKVDDVDAVTSSIWLPTTEIVVCNGKLINTDDSESVEAEQIR